jgi:hypothetical protein
MPIDHRLHSTPIGARRWNERGDDFLAQIVATLPESARVLATVLFADIVTVGKGVGKLVSAYSNGTTNEVLRNPAGDTAEDAYEATAVTAPKGTCIP